MLSISPVSNKQNPFLLYNDVFFFLFGKASCINHAYKAQNLNIKNSNQSGFNIIHLKFLKIVYIRQRSVPIVKNIVCNKRERNHKNFENHEKAGILYYFKYKLHLPQSNLVVPSIHLTLVCERLTRNKNNSDNNAKQ